MIAFAIRVVVSGVISAAAGASLSGVAASFSFPGSGDPESGGCEPPSGDGVTFVFESSSSPHATTRPALIASATKLLIKARFCITGSSLRGRRRGQTGWLSSDGPALAQHG